MPGDDLVLPERVGNVLVATMNRPQARNALNPEPLQELSAVLKEADADPGGGAIVLTGAGPVFCAGTDLKAFARGARFDGPIWFCWFCRDGVATPVVAALNGSAVAGGCELALGLRSGGGRRHRVPRSGGGRTRLLRGGRRHSPRRPHPARGGPGNGTHG